MSCGGQGGAEREPARKVTGGGSGGAVVVVVRSIHEVLKLVVVAAAGLQHQLPHPLVRLPRHRTPTSSVTFPPTTAASMAQLRPFATCLSPYGLRGLCSTDLPEGQPLPQHPNRKASPSPCTRSRRPAPPSHPTCSHQQRSSRLEFRSLSSFRATAPRRKSIACDPRHLRQSQKRNLSKRERDMFSFLFIQMFRRCYFSTLETNRILNISKGCEKRSADEAGRGGGPGRGGRGCGVRTALGGAPTWDA